MNWTTKLIRDWEDDPKTVERDMKVLYLLEDGEEIVIPYTNFEAFGETYRLRSSGVVLAHTGEELQEIVRNKSVPESITALLPEPREYQRQMFAQMKSHKINLLSCARQIGTTSVLATYTAHYLFNSWDKSINFVTKDVRRATEKILMAIAWSPYHRQSGVLEVTTYSTNEDLAVIRFENGCSIRVFDTPKLMLSPDLLVVDGIQNWGVELYSGVLPGLIARLCRIVLAGQPDREGRYQKALEWAEGMKAANPGSVGIGRWDWTHHWFELTHDIRSMLTTEEWLMEYELITPGTQEWRDRNLELLLPGS